MNTPPFALDAVATRILSTIEERRPAALSLLEEIVNIDSFTTRFEGVKKVATVFVREFEALGLDTHWSDGAGYQRAGHLIARSRNQDRQELPHVLLIGHLDTAVASFRPFSLSPDGHTAYGTGVCDMKGGDVILVEALRALHSAEVLDRLRVTVYLAGDEEDTGSPLIQARREFQQIGDQADIAIGFEGGDGDIRNALIGRRGFSTWVLEVTGRRGHAGKVFTEEIGTGAALEMSRILHSFYQTLIQRPNITFNPGVVVAGTEIVQKSGSKPGQVQAKHQRYRVSGQPNTVTNVARVNGDLRALTPEDLEWAITQMQSIVKENLPGTSATLTVVESGPPFAPTAENEKLFQLYNEGSIALGESPVAAANPRFSGVADINFVAGRVTAALDGIGIGGANEHREDEEADVSTLPLQTQRAALLLYRIATDWKRPG